MPPLVRPYQERLAELQAAQNQRMRQMVDNTALRGASQMIDMNPRTVKALLKQSFRDMIPEVVWNNVYRSDETHLCKEDCEYIKLTFYNDRSVGLKVKVEGRAIEPEEFDRNVTPLCDDFEEWCATAIMTCDAGEDVWDRPKIVPDMTATEVRARQLQMQQSLQGVMGGLTAGLGQAAQRGALQGLAAQMGLSGVVK